MRLAGRDINRAVTALYGVYGPVFAFGVGPVRFIWFVGPEANKFVLEDAATHFQLGPAYGFLRTIGGSAALITSDEPEHLRRRRLVQPAFHRSRLASLETLLETRLTELFGSWVGRTVDLYKEVQGRVLEVICEVLLGRAALTTPLTADINRMMRFANLPFQYQLVKLRVPGSPWARFLAARERADAALYREIRRRRETGDFGDDVLGLLLETKDEDGQGLNELEMRDQAISLVSAGFDTTSAALTWAVLELHRQPELLAELRAELSTSDEPPLLAQVIKETLRLYPPAPAGLRRASRDLTFGGYHIPAGHPAAFSIYAAHRSAASYPEPLRFDPKRWETFTPPPYSYLPFGSGARYCIGSGLATRVLTLGLKHLLRDYTLTPLWAEPVAEAGNTLHPRGGLPVRVARAPSQDAPRAPASPRASRYR